MYEELWEKEGQDRLEAIDELPIFATIDICVQMLRTKKKCSCCPLAILYRDSEDRERLLCVEVATRRRVENALMFGGHFVKKGE